MVAIAGSLSAWVVTSYINRLSGWDAVLELHVAQIAGSTDIFTGFKEPALCHQLYYKNVTGRCTFEPQQQVRR